MIRGQIRIDIFSSLEMGYNNDAVNTKSEIKSKPV
jgi:hypothetical protein